MGMFSCPRTFTCAFLALISAACLRQEQAPPHSAHPENGNVMVAMDEDQFWSIVATSLEGGASQRVQARRIISTLGELPADEIAAYERIYSQKMRAAYSWDLWAAAHIIHGGASDDGFEYFRRWLISRGQKVYEAALENPDALAELIPASQRGPAEFESFGYLAADAWKSKMGIDPYTATTDVGFFSLDMIRSAFEARPSGEPFEDDADYLSQRWPELWKRFGDNPLH